MKKLSVFAALLCSVTMFAQTELVDFSKISLDSWGNNQKPDVVLADQVFTITIKATDGFQWGNQVKITLGNVATAGLDLNKEYQLSFTATASTADCGGVTLKFFDDNALSFSGNDCGETARVHSEGCLALNETPLNYQSEWIQPEAAATNGTIVFAFGWDPAQTVTISNLSFKERAATTAIDNVNTKASAVKVVEDGQLIIIKNGIRYNVAGQQIK